MTGYAEYAILTNADRQETKDNTANGYADAICRSCGIPLTGQGILGTNSDDNINANYCRYCYDKGEFIDKVSMETYIDMCSRFGAQADMNNEEMKVFCTKLLPTLKRWKR